MVERGEKGYRVLLGGVLYNVQVEDERRRRLLAGRSKPAAPVGDMHVKAPIPGLIVKVEVEVGQHVRADQPLVILEAMKMENEIRAPQAGIVREVRVSPGDSVEQGAVLVVLG
ncbi:MAG: acetyl-CoA carboxylase biotin carboxyl carrier protein subunit [Chloroflexi bacterium]|nr:acetyl-CoA carboxylase biotin carboxyl carrier protein subunit [Chloroflexota bacterium]